MEVETPMENHNIEEEVASYFTGINDVEEGKKIINDLLNGMNIEKFNEFVKRCYQLKSLFKLANNNLARLHSKDAGVIKTLTGGKIILHNLEMAITCNQQAINSMEIVKTICNILHKKKKILTSYVWVVFHI